MFSLTLKPKTVTVFPDTNWFSQSCSSVPIAQSVLYSWTSGMLRAQGHIIRFVLISFLLFKGKYVVFFKWHKMCIDLDRKALHVGVGKCQICLCTPDLLRHFTICRILQDPMSWQTPVLITPLSCPQTHASHWKGHSVALKGAIRPEWHRMTFLDSLLFIDFMV